MLNNLTLLIAPPFPFNLVISPLLAYTVSQRKKNEH